MGVRWLFEFARGVRGIFSIIFLCKYKKFEFSEEEYRPLDPTFISQARNKVHGRSVHYCHGFTYTDRRGS